MAENEPDSFPEPLDVDWTQVRRAVEGGLDLPEAAKVFQIGYEAVKKRAQRENWMHPRLLEKLSQEKKANAEKAALELSLGCPELSEKSENRPITAVSALLDNFDDINQRNRLTLLKLAGKGLKRALDAPPEIENWSDIAHAAKVAALAGNWGQAQVQVNVGAFSEMREAGGVIETECSTKDSEDGEESERSSYFAD